jgi:hypothetical protein
MHLDPKSLPRLAIGWSLVLGPLAYLVSSIASPPLHATDAASLAEVARHQDRFYVYALFIIIGTMFFVPAFVGLMQLLRDRAPWLGYVGGGLAGFGILVALGDSTTELMFWQMGSPGADPAQMVALAHRYDTAIGSSLIFAIGGIATIVGFVLVGVGLWRARVVPAWAALCVPAGAILNIVGFSVHSVAILIVSSVVLLVGLGRVAPAFLGRGERARAGREARATLAA